MRCTSKRGNILIIYKNIALVNIYVLRHRKLYIRYLRRGTVVGADADVVLAIRDLKEKNGWDAYTIPHVYAHRRTRE